MKLRRAFDLFMVFIAGPLGLPYVLFMAVIPEALSGEILGTWLAEVDWRHLEWCILVRQRFDRVLSVIACLRQQRSKCQLRLRCRYNLLITASWPACHAS